MQRLHTESSMHERPLSAEDLENIRKADFIIQNAPVAIASLKGRDLIIESANNIVLEIWGKSNDIISKPLAQALPELQGQTFLDRLDDVFTTGVAYKGSEERALLHRNNRLEESFFNFVYQPVKDVQGQTTSIIVVATDVTEQVNARKQIEVSEHRLRSLVMTAHYALMILSGRDWVIDIANQPLADLWNMKAEDVMGRRLMDVLPEIKDQPFPALLQQVYNSGVGYGQEEELFYLDTPQGTVTKYVSFYYDPMFDIAGQVCGIIVAAEDITVRVQDRKAKERALEQLRLAVDAANLGTWNMNTGSNQLMASPRLKELFGFHPDEEMTRDDAAQCITDEYRQDVINEVNNAIQNNSGYDLEYPVIGRHDKKLRWIKATGKYYAEEHGVAPGFSGIVLNITGRKMEELRKNDFIGMVSHELKTPLTSLKGYLQLLAVKARENENGFIVSLLDKAQKQTGRMETMIKGFLDVARLESGKIHLNFEPFDLAELIRELIDENLLLYQSHRIEFDECESMLVHGDKDKIGQVINNLISNAVKYSPAGSRIRLICGQQDNAVQVSVTDMKGLELNQPI